MGNDKPKLNWHFGDDTEEGQKRTHNRESTSGRDEKKVKQSFWLRRHYQATAVSLLLLTLLMLYGYQLYQQGEPDLAQMHRALQAAVEAEAWAWYTDHAALPGSVLDEQAPTAWTEDFQLYAAWLRHTAGAQATRPVVQVEQIELNGDWALIHVLVTRSGLPWLVQPYRETRFYRAVKGRWRQTTPVPRFLGHTR